MLLELLLVVLGVFLGMTVSEAAREYGRVRDLYWDRPGRRSIGEGTEGPLRLRNAVLLLRRHVVFYRSYLVDTVRPRLVETIAALERDLHVDHD